MSEHGEDARRLRDLWLDGRGDLSLLLKTLGGGRVLGTRRLTPAFAETFGDFHPFSLGCWS